MSTKLNRISEIAKRSKEVKFTSLAHLLNEEFLTETWTQMNRKGAAGVDHLTIEDYGEDLEGNLRKLICSLKSGSYRATPSRRVEIPKGDGKTTRPLSIPTVEDRLLQKAVSRILEAIFEADFLECSYGFRPNRGPHHALKDVRHQIIARKTMWIYEVDIKGYFNSVNHQWLNQMLSQRIKDPIILRLIGKWLKAGVMKDGIQTVAREGTPQGGPISCILSNIYLHFVLDLWFERSVHPRLKGQSKLVRFVDDFIICFQDQQDAFKVRKVLKKRLEKFGLSIAEDKTDLICFGRFARERMNACGRETKTFVFLGFKHVCGRDRAGRFALIRIPSAKACSKFIKKTKTWLWQHMHWTTKQHQTQLKQMLQGFYAYFGLTHCTHKLNLVRDLVRRQWKRVLSRRSQKGPYRYWSFLVKQDWFSLPNPKVYHAGI